MSTKRIVLTALAAFVVLLGVVVYFTFDPSCPSLSKYFPKCPFYSLTGLKCPGCGTQRALHEILNGNITGALHYNALLLVAVPLIGLYWLADAIKKRHPALDNVLNHPAAIITIVIVVIAWCIARNLWGF